MNKLLDTSNQLDIFNRTKIKLSNLIKKYYYSNIGRGIKDFKIIQAKNKELEFGNQFRIITERNPYGGGSTYSIIKVASKSVIALVVVNYLYYNTFTRGVPGQYYKVVAFNKEEFEYQLGRLK